MYTSDREQLKIRVGKITSGIFPALVAIVISCWWLSSCSLFGVATTTTAPAESEQKSKGEKRMRHSTNKSEPNPLMPDLPLINQGGEQIFFHSDLISGKTVAINFIYTDCSLTCDMQGKNFAKIQELIGNRLGRDIYLVTISKNPQEDTPELMAAWARKYQPKTGWEILTGEPDDVSKIIQPFIGGFNRQLEHIPVMFIINEEKGVRERIDGLSTPESVVKLLITTADSPPAESEFNAPKSGLK